MKNIKHQLIQVVISRLLIVVGYMANRNYKFKLRSEEKTYSAIINKVGSIHDFGYGFNGDIFKALLVYYGRLISVKCTHPNRKFLYYIVDKNAPIYIVRGNHNFYTAILLNNSHMSYIAPFNVLSIPEYCKEFNENELNLLWGKDIYFLPNFHRNSNGICKFESFEKFSEQVREISNDIVMVHLDKFMEEYNGGFDGDQLDLFGAVSQWKGTDTGSFCNSLLYFCDSGSNFDKGGAL